MNQVRLDINEVIPYLLRSGILSTKSALESRLEIQDACGTNVGYTVTGLCGPSLFIKQWLDDPQSATRESDLYSTFTSNIKLKSILPSLVHYDGSRSILVTEYVFDGTPFSSYGFRLSTPPLSDAVRLGQILALLHSEGSALRSIRRFETDPSWMLCLHEIWADELETLSGGYIEIVQRLQRHRSFGETVKGLVACWPRTHLIHGDLRWDNLARRRSPRAASPDIRIIDWEHAGIGDPAWDVASILSSYLFSWLVSGRHSTNTPLATVSRASYPISSLQRLLSRFWNAYHDSVNEIRLDSLRTCQLCAVALARRVLEESQRYDSLNSRLAIGLQASLNIAERPVEAWRHLFGIRHG